MAIDYTLVTFAEALAMRAAHNRNPPTETPWRATIHNEGHRDQAWVLDAPAANTYSLAWLYDVENGAGDEARYIVAAVNEHGRLVETVIAQAAEIERLTAECAVARKDVDEAETLVSKQSALLTGVANALRGDPPPLASHGHHDLPERASAAVAERDRLQRVCDEALPREAIPCPQCKAPHVEGPRFDNPALDGRTRPHHSHRCYHCTHVWDSGRWSFGVAPEAATASVGAFTSVWYWGQSGGAGKPHVMSYRHMPHDASDAYVQPVRLLPELLERANVRDGDEFTVTVQKTGRRPFGDRRYVWTAEGEYAREPAENAAR